MKKTIMKKTISSLLILSVLLIPSTSFAATNNNAGNDLEASNRLLIEKLDDAQTVSETDKTIRSFLKEQKIDPSDVPTSNSGENISLKFVNDKIKNSSYKSYDLNDGGKLFFADDLGCIITIYTEETSGMTNKITALSASGTANKITALFTSAASSWKTTSYTKTFKFYSTTGLTCFTIKLGGDFKYNGTTSTAELTKAAFAAPGLSPWVSPDWSSGEKNYTRSSKVYGFGTAYQNLGISDFSFKWNYIDFDAKITCDKNGVIDYDCEFTDGE